MLIILTFYTLGKLSSPVIKNAEIEIHGCNVKLTWSPPRDNECPLSMYVLHYREIKPHGNEVDWQQISITEVANNTYVIPLNCDAEYEISMSARDEKRESTMSNVWQIETNSQSSGTGQQRTGRTKPFFLASI